MYIAYWDDTKLSGESASKPHIRFPSYRQVRQKKCIASCLKARGQDPAAELEDDMLFIVHNGFRAGGFSLTRLQVCVAASCPFLRAAALSHPPLDPCQGCPTYVDCHSRADAQMRCAFRVSVPMFVRL